MQEDNKSKSKSVNKDKSKLLEPKHQEEQEEGRHESLGGRVALVEGKTTVKAC